MREWLRQADGGLRSEPTTTDGERRTTGICWDDSARRPSVYRGWRGHKITSCGCMTTRRHHGTRGTRRRCTWIIRYERKRFSRKNPSGRRHGETGAGGFLHREGFPTRGVGTAGGSAGAGRVVAGIRHERTEERPGAEPATEV